MTRWKLWMAGGLAVALVGAVWAWRDEIETRVRYAVQGEQLEQALREAEQEAARQRELRKAADNIAEARADLVRALRQRQDDLRADLRALERTNDEVAAWADRRVPGAILDRLREQPGDGGQDGNGGGDTAN